MIKIFIPFSCLLLISSALQVKLQHQEEFIAGPINIQADNGVYLTRCRACGPSGYPDTASIQETNPDKPWAVWVA